MRREQFRCQPYLLLRSQNALEPHLSWLPLMWPSLLDHLVVPEDPALIVSSFVVVEFGCIFPLAPNGRFLSSSNFERNHLG